MRIALPGGGDVLEPTNDSAAGLPLGAAVVNTAGGLGGPRGATRGHERTVRFPDPHADRAALIDAAPPAVGGGERPDAAPPRVFAGYAHQHLDDDPTYRAALAGRAARPTALLGRDIDVALTTATFPLDTTPGRHLAVLGPSAAGAELLDAAARSARRAPPAAHRAVRHRLAGRGGRRARRGPRGRPAASGRRWRRSTRPGSAKALTVDQPGYLVVFGMDATGPGALPADRLREVLRAGPSRGVHLLSWWRGLRRFNEEVGGSAAREDVAGLVFLNVPAADVSLMVGRPVDWHPRPNRALLHDRHADRTTVFVPFAHPGSERHDGVGRLLRRRAAARRDPPGRGHRGGRAGAGGTGGPGGARRRTGPAGPRSRPGCARPVCRTTS